MLSPLVARASYVDLIEQERAERQDDAANAPAAPLEPPKSRHGYGRKRQLDRDLAHHYERCKTQSAGRFQTERRLKGYCAAVAWSNVKRSGRFADYPTFQNQPKEKPTMARRMPPRDSKGRFLKRGGSRRAKESSRRSSAPRRASSPRRRASAPAAAAPRRRASSPKRNKSGSRRPSAARRRPSQTNIAIVPVGGMAREAPRRRVLRRPRRASEMAYEAPAATATGLVLFYGAGMVGNLTADVLDRILAGVNPDSKPDVKTAPPAYQTDSYPFIYNNDAAAMAPGIGRIGLQLLLVVLGIGGGMLFESPALKFMAYGFGAGAFFHLSTQLLNAYVIVPLVTPAQGDATSVTGYGAAMYTHEVATRMAVASTTVGSGYMGRAPTSRQVPHNRVGSPPPQLPAGAPKLPAEQPPRVPVALTSVAPAQQQQQQPQTMGAPPACPQGCNCDKHKTAETVGHPPNGQSYEGNAHPLYSALLFPGQRAAA